MGVAQRFLKTVVRFSGMAGAQVPVLTLSASRVNITTSGGTSSAETALPAGAQVLRISATEACWIAFGHTGMGAASAGTGSMYFPAGAEYVSVPEDSTGVYDYVRVIKAGTNETTIQFERID